VFSLRNIGRLNNPVTTSTFNVFGGGGADGIIPPYNSPFPKLVGKEKPKPPVVPKDPCGNTTDINVGIGFVQFGVQIGQHGIYPYGGFALSFPGVTGSITTTNSSPSSGRYFTGSLGLVIGGTRSVPVNSSPTELLNPNSRVATTSFGAVSPQASVGVIRAEVIGFPNGKKECLK
jgi:hypothetical protein